MSKNHNQPNLLGYTSPDEQQEQHIINRSDSLNSKFWHKPVVLYIFFAAIFATVGSITAWLSFANAPAKVAGPDTVSQQMTGWISGLSKNVGLHSRSILSQKEISSSVKTLRGTSLSAAAKVRQKDYDNHPKVIQRTADGQIVKGYRDPTGLKGNAVIYDMLTLPSSYQVNTNCVDPKTSRSLMSFYAFPQRSPASNHFNSSTVPAMQSLIKLANGKLALGTNPRSSPQAILKTPCDANGNPAVFPAAVAIPNVDSEGRFVMRGSFSTDKCSSTGTASGGQIPSDWDVARYIDCIVFNGTSIYAQHYLVFYDPAVDSAGYSVQDGSGITYSMPDGSPDPWTDPGAVKSVANVNNKLNSVALLYGNSVWVNTPADPMANPIPYWQTHDLPHEILHTMGAVNWQAPNATSSGHCIDGSDLMCYNDYSPTYDEYGIAHSNIGYLDPEEPAKANEKWNFSFWVKAGDSKAVNKPITLFIHEGPGSFWMWETTKTVKLKSTWQKVSLSYTAQGDYWWGATAWPTYIDIGMERYGNTAPSENILIDNEILTRSAYPKYTNYLQRSESYYNFDPSYEKSDAIPWTENATGQIIPQPNAPDGTHVLKLAYSNPPHFHAGSEYAETVCPAYSTQDLALDCHGDDFFNRNPKAGSYLATHWNVAGSENCFLSFPGKSDNPSCKAPPRVSVSANPTSIVIGNGFHGILGTRITWSSTDGASSCSVYLYDAYKFSGGSTGNNVQINGLNVGKNNIKVTCANASGSASATATVTVTIKQ